MIQRCYGEMATRLCYAEDCPNIFSPTGTRQLFCSTQCKHRQTSKNRVRSNPEYVRAANRKSYHKDIGQSRLRNRKKYSRNLVSERARSRTYAQLHRDKARLRGKRHNPKRIAAKRGAIILSLSDPEWQKIKGDWDNHCAYCGISGVPITQDHIVALMKGGQHVASNILPACRSCNAAKGTKSLTEFLIYRGQTTLWPH